MVETSRIQAAILAGGLGTRLRPAISDRPKVLAAVNNRPFLTYLLRQVELCGIRRAIVCTGYLTEQVEACFGHRFGKALDLVYSRESSPLGTAGALKQALRELYCDFVLVMNGDSFVAIDLETFVRNHKNSDDGSLVLVRVADSARYDCVDVDADGRITSFGVERRQQKDRWVNAGIYLLSRHLIEKIPNGRAVSLEREMLPIWSTKNLRGYRTKAAFIDIGTPDSYASSGRFMSALVWN